MTPSGYRPVRLVVVLLAVLAATLVARVLLVASANGDRVRADKLEGIPAIEGRYYPVPKVCLVVDDSELEEPLEGTSLDRSPFSLHANGNIFALHEPQSGGAGSVYLGCEFVNYDFDTNPQVSFSFTGSVRTARIDQRFRCGAGAEPGTEASEVSLGRYGACRTTDGFEIALNVVDDNAVLDCKVKSVDETLLPGLERSLRTECVSLLDRMARSRPIPYTGNAFLTVR